MSAKKMTKKQICDAAVGMYLDNPSRFSLSAVANQLEIPRSQIYQNFPTKNAVLRFFYQDCFEQYLKQTDEMEDYQDFSLEEKLSHMVYTHFELFQREKEFVEDTFKDLIAKASAKSKFQQMLEDRIDLLLSQSHGDASLLQGPYLSQFIVKELFYLFRFWLQDESDEAEQTMELTDKLISFASEVLGSQIFSKGIDLGRTLWDQDLIRFKPQSLNILARALMQRYS